MKRANERGVALVITLILMLALSVMAVSILFVSQSETWSSMNYRFMSQARYGAEAGLGQAANYLLYTYTPPGGTGDPLNAYTMTASPVSYSGNPVVLSANSSVSANYPVSSVQSSFHTAAQGALTSGNTTINYSAYATLLAMRQVSVYGSTTPATIQTWLLTSDGTINDVRNAQVEVSAIMERLVTPVFKYAVFASNNGCSALQFGGGGTTDSYDSSTVVNGSVTTQAYAGNVGTNGNLTTGGNPTTINGSLSTPRAGVGTCTQNNVTAWQDNQGKVTGGVIELPQPVVYPPPTIPPPGTTDLSLTHGWSCPSGANAIPGCSSSGSDITIPPGSYGNISITGQTNLHLSAGTYNINSLKEMSAQSGIIIDSGPVILNVTGSNVSGSVVDLTGNSVQNSSLVPTNFQILYAGSGTISLKGNTQASGLLYAPQASFSFAGKAPWYGAVVGALMTDLGGSAVHYDRRLQDSGFTLGNYMLSSFTWKKF